MNDHNSSGYLFSPFVVGIFLVVGYVTTHQGVAFFGKWNSPLGEPFDAAQLPGIRLESLRRQNKDLLAEIYVDLEQFSSALSSKEKAQQLKDLRFQEVLRREAEVKDALQTLRPLWKFSEASTTLRVESFAMPIGEPSLKAPRVELLFSVPSPMPATEFGPD